MRIKNYLQSTGEILRETLGRRGGEWPVYTADCMD